MTGPVAVVIVSYETRELTLRCVEGALAHGAVPGFETRVVVVDNASTDGTVDAVRSRFGDRADVIAGAGNIGFGAAANLGASRVPDAAWLMILNADVELLPGALATLVAEGETNLQHAVLGPSVVGDDGRPQLSVRGHPTRLALLHQHTALRFLRVGADAYARYRSPPEPEVLMGAALLVRGTVFRALGGFDPGYFLYFEDADLCRRAAALGRTIRFVPAATVRHASGASADHDRERALTWYLASLFEYVDTFHGPFAGTLYRLAFKPLFLVKVVCDAVRDTLGLAAGRKGKAKELGTAGKFAFRGMWEFLVD